MGRGLGDLQRQILEALEKLWESHGPIVRLVEPGTSPKNRKIMLQAARRLRDRGLVEYIHRWDIDSRDKPALVVCLCPVGAMVFSKELGKEVPVSQLDVSHSDVGERAKDKLGKMLSRHYASAGIHLSPRDALEEGLAGDDPTEELTLEERIDRLQAKLSGQG